MCHKEEFLSSFTLNFLITMGILSNIIVKIKWDEIWKMFRVILVSEWPWSDTDLVPTSTMKRIYSRVQYPQPKLMATFVYNYIPILKKRKKMNMNDLLETCLVFKIFFDSRLSKHTFCFTLTLKQLRLCFGVWNQVPVMMPLTAIMINALPPPRPLPWGRLR